MRHLHTKNLRMIVFVFVGFWSILPLDGPSIVGRGSVVRPASASAGPAPSCESPLQDLRGQLERVFRTQQRNGEIAFEGTDSLFYHHPLMATLALEVFGATRDVAFLESAHGVIKGYFNYLLVYHDADRDFLVERSSSGIPGDAGDIEDVGFNAMLALDMLSLSRICVELNMPVDALFWYRGMRTVSRQLVKASYDPDASYFLPTRATASKRENVFYGLSALPTYFASELGDEISLDVLRNSLLADRGLQPENPAHSLTWDFSPAERLAAGHTARMLRTLLLLGALEWNGLRGEASRRAAGIWARISEDPARDGSAASDDEAGRYASCVLESAGPYAPFPRYQELTLLDHLVFQKALLDPEKTAALRRSAGEVRRFLLSHPGGADSTAGVADSTADCETVTRSIREVYFSVSLLRDKWKQRVLFSQSDRSEISGFDIYGAASDLWDDVIETLQHAENLVVRSRWHAQGFDLAAKLEKTSVGPGEFVPVRFAASARAQTVGIRTIVVLRNEAVDTLLSSPSPLNVSPGKPPREFRYKYPTPRGHESTIVPIAFAVDIRFENGERMRYHFHEGVFITQPVTYTVRFPSGTTLTNGAVPVQILVKKHLPVAISIQAQWYSPAGLKPIEGRSIEASMPENVGQAMMTMNILVPNPCRPGSFPFTLTVFANAEQAGTISSRLFKHYEWLFVGPFPGKRGALDTRYPPESHVNLFDTYTGALGHVTWQPLPVKACVDDGRLALGSVLPEGSVGFLYTVIESATRRTSAVLFESNTPALLYVNGELLGRSTGEGSSSPQRFDVSLKTGMNNVLIKTLSTSSPLVFFQLGDEEDLMTDEFNNNLWELVDGYQELVARGRDGGKEDGQIQRRVTITYRNTAVGSVSVVGSFNGWSPANSTMRPNKYGEWEINLYLAPGRYTYRFLVDERAETIDPSSPYTEPDGYGGQNSVLYVQ